MYKGLTTKKENAREFNETWVEGDLIHSGGKVYIHPVCNKVSVNGELGKIIVMHEVQPETVTQIMTDKKMTLRELLSHFTNKTTWVDLCTPLWRKCGEVKHIENELPDQILDTKISNWTFTNSVNIDM